MTQFFEHYRQLWLGIVSILFIPQPKILVNVSSQIFFCIVTFIWILVLKFILETVFNFYLLHYKQWYKLEFTYYLKQKTIIALSSCEFFINNSIKGIYCAWINKDLESFIFSIVNVDKCSIRYLKRIFTKYY